MSVDKPNEPKPIYTGNGLTFEEALADASDDAFERGANGQRLNVIRHEVVIGNGHVSDHIVYLG